MLLLDNLCHLLLLCFLARYDTLDVNGHLMTCLEEAMLIDEATHRQFFHHFIDYCSTSYSVQMMSLFSFII
jgi:hypothetical protein